MKKHCVPAWVAILTAIALLANNYLYQGIFVAIPNWNDAAERSWFQAGALLVAWIIW